MQIIWDRAVVEQLKKTHTLLELETFNVNDQFMTAFCVIPAEKIGLDGFSRLENNKEMHLAFVRAYYNKDYKLCRDIAEHLIGQFGGEVDTFYEEILNRIDNETTTSNS